MIFILYLHHTPGILPGSHILVSNFDKVVAANNCKWKMTVVVSIGFCYCFILQWELVDGDSIGLQLVHDLCLELGELCLVDRVSLGDDWDDVDLLVQLLHTDQIYRLETMAIRGDKIEADMDPGVMVGVQVPLDLQLLLQVGLELEVSVIHNGLETILLVYLVSIPNSIHQGQLQIHVAFLKNTYCNHLKKTSIIAREVSRIIKNKLGLSCAKLN